MPYSRGYRDRDNFDEQRCDELFGVSPYEEPPHCPLSFLKRAARGATRAVRPDVPSAALLPSGARPAALSQSSRPGVGQGGS